MPKYATALILSGGGARFGYYMGVYAGLCDLGKQPDIIIGSCGGANIAGLISLCPDPTLAKQMMLSRSFYQMFCRIQPRRPAKLKIHKHRALSNASKRWLSFQKTKFINTQTAQTKTQIKTKTPKSPLPLSMIDHLHTHALYQIADDTDDNSFWQSDKLLQEISQTNLLPKTKLNTQLKKVSTLIVLSRTFQCSSIDNSDHSSFLWQQVLRSDNAELTKHLKQLQNSSDKGNITANISNHSPHILPDLHIVNGDDMPLATAIRASINDMFYFPPTSHAFHTDKSKDMNKHRNKDKKSDSTHKTEQQICTLMGGVIDLLPIELACQLADTVYAEYKSPFDGLLAEPAIHSIFGFKANNRRADWHRFKHPTGNIHWIDTADIHSQKPAHNIPPISNRKMKLTQGYIDIKHPSYDDFVDIMQKQYEYGYNKTMNTINNEESC